MVAFSRKSLSNDALTRSPGSMKPCARMPKIFGILRFKKFMLILIFRFLGEYGENVIYTAILGGILGSSQGEVPLDVTCAFERRGNLQRY